MSSQEYRAIIFDFDGVLADTMEDLFWAWRRAVMQFGYEISREEYFPLEGMNVFEIARIMCERAHISPAHADAIVQSKDVYYRENNRFSLYPGVLDFISLLSLRGVPMAIVSAAFRERLEQTVPQHFLSRFSAIITTEKGVRGKPFPDLYLAGVRALGVTPYETIVVENAPLGVRAAKTAGCYCIAICSTNVPEILTEADQVIKSFSEIANATAVRSLLNREISSVAIHE